MRLLVQAGGWMVALFVVAFVGAFGGITLARTVVPREPAPAVGAVTVPSQYLIQGTIDTTPPIGDAQQMTFPFLLVLHDDDNNVTCWALVPVTGVGGLACMPDSEFKREESQ